MCVALAKVSACSQRLCWVSALAVVGWTPVERMKSAVSSIQLTAWHCCVGCFQVIWAQYQCIASAKVYVKGHWLRKYIVASGLHMRWKLGGIGLSVHGIGSVGVWSGCVGGVRSGLGCVGLWFG